MELGRMKFLAEQRLRQSKLSWTILRPTTFTETFQQILCAPLLDKGKTMLFGRSREPINFVSAHDVARFVERSVSDSGMKGLAMDIGGRKTSRSSSLSRPSVRRWGCPAP
jgi:uncharacterized protein YbjT (DUF2867 family)